MRAYKTALMRKSLIRKAKRNNRLQVAKAIATEVLKPDYSFFLLFVFVGSMCLAVWSINIYRNTFMDWRLLILPSVMGAFVANLLFFSRLRKAGEKNLTAFLLCGISGGCIAHFLTMYLNQKFVSTEEHQEIVFPVLHRGRLAKGKGSSCAQPYVSITFNGLGKDVMFSCAEDRLVFQADSVWIVCSKGLFGFEVIQAKSLR